MGYQDYAWGHRIDQKTDQQVLKQRRGERESDRGEREGGGYMDG